MMTHQEINERATKALKRAAVQESHEVRKRIMQWANLLENGIQAGEYTGYIALDIPARTHEGKLLGHFNVTLECLGESVMPAGVIAFHQWDGEQKMFVQSVTDNPQA